MGAFDEDRLALRKPGGRNRYLETVARLGVRALDWDSDEELQRLVTYIAEELTE